MSGKLTRGENVNYSMSSLRTEFFEGDPSDDGLEALLQAPGTGHDLPQPLGADAALSHRRHQGCRGLLGVEQLHRATRLGSRARTRPSSRCWTRRGVYG
ncbi:hypothetical protein NHJ13734_009789 [Beauveria thailandica]